MKKLFMVTVLCLVCSCNTRWTTSDGKHHYTADQLNKRIQYRIEKGMQYNHNKVERERPLKIKTLSRD